VGRSNLLNPRNGDKRRKDKRSVDVSILVCSGGCGIGSGAGTGDTSALASAIASSAIIQVYFRDVRSTNRNQTNSLDSAGSISSRGLLSDVDAKRLLTNR